MKYTESQICRLYDQNPNMTLKQLSRITGLPITWLKRILMNGGVAP